MSCINPECRNGQAPGVTVRGNGTHDGARPVIDQSGKPRATMFWTIIPCPACRPSSKGPSYNPVNRTAEEIEQRWQLAKVRAPYNPRPKTPAQNELGDTGRLESIRAATPTPAPQMAIPNNQIAERIAAALEKLTARVEILTGAVLELIETQTHPITELKSDLDPKSLETIEIETDRLDKGVPLVSAAHPTPKSETPITRAEIAELLREMVDSARMSSPCVTEKAKSSETEPKPTRAASRSSRVKKTAGSARKRGGTSAASTE